MCRRRFLEDYNMTRKKNPFGKTADKNKPYAVYSTGDFLWKVLKTYKVADNEQNDPYARWFCFVTSSLCPEGEYGDTYALDVKQYGQLMQCTPEWRDAYNA